MSRSTATRTDALSSEHRQQRGDRRCAPTPTERAVGDPSPPRPRISFALVRPGSAPNGGRPFGTFRERVLSSTVRNVPLHLPT